MPPPEELNDRLHKLQEDLESLSLRFQSNDDKEDDIMMELSSLGDSTSSQYRPSAASRSSSSSTSHRPAWRKRVKLKKNNLSSSSDNTKQQQQQHRTAANEHSNDNTSDIIVQRLLNENAILTQDLEKTRAAYVRLQDKTSDSDQFRTMYEELQGLYSALQESYKTSEKIRQQQQEEIQSLRLQTDTTAWDNTLISDKPTTINDDTALDLLLSKKPAAQKTMRRKKKSLSSKIDFIKQNRLNISAHQERLSRLKKAEELRASRLDPPSNAVKKKSSTKKKRRKVKQQQHSTSLTASSRSRMAANLDVSQHSLCMRAPKPFY